MASSSSSLNFFLIISVKSFQLLASLSKCKMRVVSLYVILILIRVSVVIVQCIFEGRDMFFFFKKYLQITSIYIFFSRERVKRIILWDGTNLWAKLLFYPRSSEMCFFFKVYFQRVPTVVWNSRK